MITIQSFEELCSYLREWRSFDDREGPYDFIGMVELLKACLDNLHAHALETELEELGECDLLDLQQPLLERLLARKPSR